MATSAERMGDGARGRPDRNGPFQGGPGREGCAARPGRCLPFGGVVHNLPAMQLTEAQAQQAREWLKDGLKLSDFQKRVEKEFGLRLTYMDTRLLVDDLRVVPKDVEPPKAPEPAAPAPPPAPGTAPATTQAFSPGSFPGQGGFTPGTPAAAPMPEAEPAMPPASGNVSVTTDAITRVGALASGSITFSDGQKAQWYLDQTGRFGMVPAQRGYRPSPQDVQEVQMLLERELQKLGY